MQATRWGSVVASGSIAVTVVVAVWARSSSRSRVREWSRGSRSSAGQHSVKFHPPESVGGQDGGVSDTRPEGARPTKPLRKIVLGVIIAVVAVFGLAQLIPIRVTNPPARVEPRWDSPQTRQLVMAACADCHSNQSRHFWYEDIAPIKWWTANHTDS